MYCSDYVALTEMDLQDEFTEKVHSEFTVNEETDRKHRAGCVWRILGYEASKEDIIHWAGFYGVTYEICMKYKSFWRNLHENSVRR